MLLKESNAIFEANEFLGNTHDAFVMTIHLIQPFFRIHSKNKTI